MMKWLFKYKYPHMTHYTSNDNNWKWWKRSVVVLAIAFNYIQYYLHSSCFFVFFLLYCTFEICFLYEIDLGRLVYTYILYMCIQYITHAKHLFIYNIYIHTFIFIYIYSYACSHTTRHLWTYLWRIASVLNTVLITVFVARYYTGEIIFLCVCFYCI